MATVTVKSKTLSDIAAAIRKTSGTSETYKPREMAAAIRNIVRGDSADLINYLEGETVPLNLRSYRDYSFAFDNEISGFVEFENAATVPHGFCYYAPNLVRADFYHNISYVGDLAFTTDHQDYEAAALKCVVFWGRVDGISNMAFYSSPCKAIVFYGNTFAPTLDNSMSSFLHASSAKIYVQADYLEKFKTASGWSAVANKIYAIEDHPEVWNYGLNDDGTPMT